MTANGNVTLMLRPRDPLIVRDARPFDPTPGARATTLPWPWPQSVAGALRTHIGDAIGLDWTKHDDVKQVHEIAFQGPLLVARSDPEADWQPYIPGPADAVVSRGGSDAPTDDRALQAMRLLPRVLQEGEGTDIPYPAVLRPLGVTDGVKPDRAVAFWSLDDMRRWLLDADDAGPPEAWIEPLPQDTRTHVAIEEETGLAREGQLFSTSGLVFHDRRKDERHLETAMLVRVSGAPDGWTPERAFIPLGGERRLTAFEPCNDVLWPNPPELPSEGIRHLRLVSVTPGLFERGWLPGWLDRKTLEGEPPSAPDLRLKLVSAAVGRRLPISGWRLRDGARGQRATRYAVPAGAVYFFDVIDGAVTSEQWRGLWLASIADKGIDRDNGYGLALPGIWSDKEKA